jgi:hypothetical protein
VSRLSGSGIGVEVPSGWEGRIYAKGPNAVLHLASFALPPNVGDYGGGATELMTNTDLFVIAMEHGDASANTPLFAARGIPRLTIDDVSTTRLQRMLEGQGGAQKFFTVAGRAFCLYVVFGSYARRGRTIPVVNGILETLTIT